MEQARTLLRVPMELGTLRCVIKRCVIDVQGEKISVYCIKGKGEAGRRKKEAQTSLCYAWQYTAHFFSPPYRSLHVRKARVLSSVELALPAAVPSSHITKKRIIPPLPASPSLPLTHSPSSLVPALLHHRTCYSQFKGQPHRKINKSLLIMKY